jgi:hypothetical protein
VSRNLPFQLRTTINGRDNLNQIVGRILILADYGISVTNWATDAANIRDVGLLI